MMFNYPTCGPFRRPRELSSFTAAAKALGLTQAALSQRIQTLEKSLDKSLFQRRGGRVMLTDAGQTLYAYVQQILDLHRDWWVGVGFLGFGALGLAGCVAALCWADVSIGLRLSMALTLVPSGLRPLRISAPSARESC